MRNIFLILLVFSSIVMAKEVTVSILPQKYFVEKIAKDKIKVNVMVKPGASPATYEPKTSQMKLLSKSDAYFAIDVPFEKVWLDKFKTANKNMIVVDTDEGIEKQEIQAHHHEETNHNEEKKADHDHEEEGHNHEGLDPHIWLDPVLVKIQAKNIYDTLVEIDSVNKEFYTKNYKDFLNELEKLDQVLNEILKNDQNKAFMVFHPSWGYFAKRYNLKQIAIEIEGKEPKPAQLVELIDEAKENNIKIVFVAPQFSKKGANTISKSIDATVTVIDPLSEDWSNNLIKVAKEIANSYK
jgi:zinc transport system substrate-binding protein